MRILLLFLLILLFAVMLTATPLQAQPETDESITPPQVAQLGRGTADTLDWHPDGNVLAVGGSLGLWLYDDVLADLAHIPETGEIAWLVWSPDGDQLATTDQDDTVRVWDVTFDPYALTLNRSWTFDDDGYLSVRLEWSPDGERLAVITSDGAQVLDVNSGETLLTIPDLEFTLAWHPDGTQIAGAVNLGEEIGRQVRVWDATSGEVVSTYFGVDSGLFWSDIIWSPDGSTLVGVTFVPAALHAWDVERGDLLNDFGPLTGDFSDIFDIWWLEDGAKFVTAERYVSAPGAQDTLKVWDATTWTPQRNYFPIGNARQIIKKPGMNEWTVTTRDGRIITWSLEQDQPLHVRSVHGQPQSLLVWSPDNQYLAAANRTGETFDIWDVTLPDQPQSQVVTIPYLRWDLVELRWSANSDKLLGFLSIPQITAPGAYPTAFIVEWDTRTGEYLDTIHETPGYFAHDGSGDYFPHYIWSDDFTRVAFANDDDGSVEIAVVEGDPNSYLSVGEVFVEIEATNIKGMAWSPDNSMLAIIIGDVNNDTITGVFDTATGDLIARVEPSFYMVEDGLFWSPDSTRLAVRGYRDIGVSGQTEERLDIVEVDRSIDLTQRIAMVTDVDKTFSAAWHPDGNYLAVAKSTGVAIYSVSSESEYHPLVEAEPTALIPDINVYVLVWSPDGKWLAGSHEDGTVRIWNVTILNE